MDKILEMLKDRSTLFSWITGSGIGGASGVFPPEYIGNVKTYAMSITSGATIGHLVDLLWVVLTTFVATTLSFFITRGWKKLMDSRTFRRNS